MRFLMLAACLLSLLPAMTVAAVPMPPVKASEDAGRIVLDNGALAVTIDKKSATVISMLVRHDGTQTEICRSLYFDSNGGATTVPAGLTAPRAGYEPLGAYVQSVRLTRRAPDTAEAVLSGGPTPLFPFVTEIHYLLRRGVCGLYAYAIFRHGPGLAAAELGQTRFVLRGPPGTELFTHHIVDDARKGPYPTSPAVRQVMDATSLLADGTVYTKYDNSVFLANHHVHGMAGHGVGVWMVNASSEYVNGGPVKQELTVHKDNTLLNMLHGGHFGSAGIALAAGEAWTKFYGPFLIYVNHAPTVNALYEDAKRRTMEEKMKWPYAWADNPDYPTKRGAVTGRLQLAGGQSAAGAWVILAAPGGDWPMQGRGYQFWTQADPNGSFVISKVRPGSYTLYAYGANQFEQFAQNDVVVTPGKTLDLETLAWQPVTHGRTLWQIGTPDRSTQEFRNGDDVRHWANFLRYPKDFPDDVAFVVGKSRERSDWNFAQWSWYSRTPFWTIQFALPRALSGMATLTLGIAASNPARGSAVALEIKVNGHPVSTLRLPKSGAAAYRSGGADSLYQVQYVTFDADLLKAGANEMTLGHQDAEPFPAPDVQRQGRVGAVMYDAVRLEVADPPEAKGRIPTLYLIGDSTVKNGTKGLQGWGDPLAEWFDPAKIRVENRARGGRSSRTYRAEGLWDSVLTALKPGDFVLMQFGHNDGGPVSGGTGRASLHGVGEETQTVTDAQAGKSEVVHSYGWYIRQYVKDAEAKGALPIVLSPIPRNIWTADGKVARSSKDYGAWAAQAAKSEGAAFIDLNALIAEKYDALGQEKVTAQYFPGDHTHTNPAGAAANAAAVVAGLRSLENSPFAAFLRPAKP